ncbi:MAG: hypothetical protein WDN02_01235 [Methylovirgula sp.]|uniref:hypothetical protein n=1 Tax=Methylovirgula sp. TaxID=1978224 RepID=UPI0030762758
MKIFRRAAPILGLLSFGLSAAPLAAAPRTINDCEKIQAADAYNQCLASFGPVAHMHGMSSGPDAGGDEGGDAGGETGEAPVRHHGHRASGSHNGRVYMELDAPASSAPVAHTHRHWTHWHSHRGHRHHH